MHKDHKAYLKFTSRARIDKSINSLLGIVEGISMDGVINALEIDYLSIWLSDHEDLRERHPFNELIPVVAEALKDGVLTTDERDDITWLCERLRSSEYYDQTTGDLQRLHAIVGGVVGDSQISEDELRGLSAWMEDHGHLRSCWPYDEIGALITSVLADKRIDEAEHQMLLSFFSEFVALLDGRTILSPIMMKDGAVTGLCAVCPEINFRGSKFCFTGASARYTRSHLAEVVERLGGEVVSGPSLKVNYLIIGVDGNPCWAYACYGRKVEKAVALRKEGARILLVHEHDFHDAVSDAG